MVNKISVSEINGYLEDGFALSILKSNSKTYEWIISNYIDLSFEDVKHSMNQPLRFHKLNVISGRSWSAINPWFMQSVMNIDVLNELNISVVQYLEAMIDDGNYIYLNLDEYYLKCRNSYSLNHYVHNNFIYGYDKECSKFKVLAYLNSTKHFGISEVSYSELSDSISSACAINNDLFKYLTCVKIDGTKSYNLNLDSIKSHLNMLLKSDNLHQMNSNIYESFIPTFFGLEAITKTAEYYRDFIESSLVPLNILLEHSTLMVERILYISKYYTFDSYDEIVFKYNKIVEKIKSLRLIVIKEHKGKSEGEINDYKKRNYLFKNIEEIKDDIQDSLEKFLSKLNLHEGINNNCFISREGPWSVTKYSLGMKITGDFELIIKFKIISDNQVGYFALGNNISIENYKPEIILYFSFLDKFISLESKGRNTHVNNVDFTFSHVNFSYRENKLISIFYGSENKKIAELELEDIVLDIIIDFFILNSYSHGPFYIEKIQVNHLSDK